MTPAQKQKVVEFAIESQKRGGEVTRVSEACGIVTAVRFIPSFTESDQWDYLGRHLSNVNYSSQKLTALNKKAKELMNEKEPSQ